MEGRGRESRGGGGEGTGELRGWMGGAGRAAGRRGGDGKAGVVLNYGERNWMAQVNFKKDIYIHAHQVTGKRIERHQTLVRVYFVFGNMHCLNPVLFILKETVHLPNM